MRVSEAGLRAVFRRIDVTPSGPVSLLGYFNDRPSAGVLDPLYCRLAAFRDPRSARRLLLVQIDTCLFDQAFAWNLRRALRAREHGAWRPPEVLAFASHTHTAPALARLYEVPRQDRYAAELAARIADAAGEAGRALASAEETFLAVARGRAEGLSFNRRWLDREGRAVTNPSRERRAQLAGPEGPVDPEVTAVWFRGADLTPRAAFVSASNHCDTVGGQRIAADWPGAMEREIARGLGVDLPVFFLPGAQGNINHFDPQTERDQTCFQEAQRLGKAYARAVLASLPEARPLAPGSRRKLLAASLQKVRLPGRPIPPAELGRARELLAAAGEAGGGQVLTASELAAGAPEVQRVLARELLRQAPSRRRSCYVPLQAVKLGGVLLCGFPGEPFVELGLALKAAAVSSGVALVLPLALSGAYQGYILPGARLSAGGYESLAASGRLGGASGERIVAHFRRLAGRR